MSIGAAPGEASPGIAARRFATALRPAPASATSVSALPGPDPETEFALEFIDEMRESHLVLMAYLFDKHRALYNEYRDSVLDNQRREIAELEHNAERLRVTVEQDLGPRIYQGEALGERLRALRENAEATLSEQQTSLEASRAEVSFRAVTSAPSHLVILPPRVP